MAVINMYKVDRDGALFADRKQAQEHDDMLALAEGFSAILERYAPGISAEAAEEAGIFLARHRTEVAVACKGKPEVLSGLLTSSSAEPEKEEKKEDDTERLSPPASLRVAG